MFDHGLKVGVALALCEHFITAPFAFRVDVSLAVNSGTLAVITVLFCVGMLC